jgi:hypothetical protein
MTTMVVTQEDFDRFLKRYSKGKYGRRMLGEAFYDTFKLTNIANQKPLMNIWAKTGDHAIRSIRENIINKEFPV